MNLLKRVEAISILILFSCTITLFASDTIHITNGEWPPYFSEHLSHYGVTSHIVEEAYRRQNIVVQYHWYPWSRALMAAQEGQYDASIGWAKTEEREKDLFFSKPILHGEIVFFHLNTITVEWDSLSDLKDYKIGAVLGMHYSDAFNQADKEHTIKVHRVSNELQLFKMLLMERVDLVVCNKDVGLQIMWDNLTKKEIRKITFSLKPLHINKLRVVFPKMGEKSIYFLEELNSGLESLNSDGTFELFYKNSLLGKYQSKRKKEKK